MLAFLTSPQVITTWISGPVAQSILAGPGWRWAFGISTIVTPFFVLPFAALVFLNDQRAKQMRGSPSNTAPRWNAKAFKKFLIDVDIVGIFVLIAGMALFLLPFS